MAPLPPPDLPDPGGNEPAPQPVPRGGWPALVVTILMGGINNATLSSGRLVMPLIALSLGASTAMVGIMSALFTVAPMLFSVAYGRWVDRVGTLVPFIAAAALPALSFAVFLAVPSTHSLLVVAAMIGTGAVFCHVAVSRAVSNGYGYAERTRNIGYLVVCYAMFQFIEPIAVAASFDHIGPAAATFCISAFSILTLLALPTGIHRFTREANPRPAPGTRGSALALFVMPNLRNKLIISATFSAGMTVLPLVVSLHSVAVGIPATKAGLMLGAYAVGSFSSRLCLPVITRHFPPRQTLLVTILAGAALYACLPYLQHLVPLIALCGIIGLALGTGVPISLSLIYGVAPEGRVNEAVGLNMAVTNFLQTMTPLSLGFVASGLGVGAMVWTLSVAMALVGLVTLRRRPR